MAHLQYMPGDPRLVDQLVYELKSKGIFDQFRKECIADVDTRPAYQNLRQRVENSVSTFLARQCWKPDLNKNQLREKLRKHILDGNYLEQGVERIVDQVVNPKVASVFIPQVEDLVYNYLGISRKKATPTAETSNSKVSTEDLLPTDLEAVSPGSVKSNDEKDEPMDTVLEEDVKMDTEENKENKEEVLPTETIEKPKVEDVHTPIVIDDTDSNISIDNSNIPLPTEDIKLENIPAPENSPPKIENEKIELEKIELPKEPNISKEIPLPDQIPLPQDNKQYFKPIALGSDDDSSSDSSLRRNMSPLTPIRNYNNENSCDAQQGFDNDSDSKSNDKKPCSFRFALESKSTEHSLDGKSEKKDETNLAYQFNNQVNINTYNTPMYEDSSNSNNLQIDYESDANSKYTEKVAEIDHNSEDSKKDKKPEEKKISHSSSQKSRDSYRHSSSKDKRSDSKQSSSRDSSRHDKKTKDDHSSKSKSTHKERERSSGTSDKKESRDSSKHRSSHKSSSQKDSKSHRSSSSSQRHSSKHSDDKKSSSSNKDKEKKSEKSSKDKRDSKSSSHRSDKDRKSSSSSSRKHDDKDKKKDKKETDDHYSLSGRGNHNRRSTDRDSNDGSSSSKGWNNQPSSKASEAKKESKEPSSKSENTSTSGESTSPSDKEVIINNASDSKTQQKPIRVENHLERPISSPPRLPFVPDVTLKKPKFAANLKEAKKMMRMRKFLDEEQKRMNQEAALLLEFQANVRPSLSQVYSSIPGPELEFACVSNEVNAGHVQTQIYETKSEVLEPANVATNVINDEMIIDEVDETKTTTDAITDENEQNKVVSNDDLNNDNADNINGDLNNDNADNSNEDLNNDNADIPNEDTLDLGANGDGDESYNENKPFSQLMDEISERNKNNDVKCENPTEDDNKKRTEYFEITIITEELSEPEEPETKDKPEKTEEASEKVSEETSEVIETTAQIPESVPVPQTVSNEEYLHYFAEHEKYDAELKLNQHNNLLKAFMEKNVVSDKIYLFNCDTYEENIIKEVASTFGHYEIINYYRNGHLTLPNTAKNVVNVTLASEITLPVETYQAPTVFSPVKSECSFELSSDYDAKLEEMVNKASRQEIMEIILGSVTDKPTIDYCTESSIDNDVSLKRKFIEAESTENNNMNILTPKIRKLSESDQISSTTEEAEETSNNNRVSNSTRSKYLGRARRVGLPRPRRANLPNSPSSDKSVENYEQNSISQPPNGKMKPTTPRNKVQRYDTSDLYKPKLHYLSRRNNIS